VRSRTHAQFGHLAVRYRIQLVFLCKVLQMLVTANVPSSPILVTLMMKALRSSETSVLTRATRRNISEDSNQNIPCLFMDSKVHFFVHKNPPLDPIQSQMNTFCVLVFLLDHFEVILPSMDRSLPFRLSDQTVAYISCIGHVFTHCTQPLWSDHRYIW
jgi:hypothetical protein